ncbi:1-deoxy-D-xylulose-5-phosphate reductoisomerase [Ferviditalea candida]|uniref:1-deoxy-D-xylulose 5-phosphate reductoisomerase n=1 Tax=Ferviditalea candida TaxID=3108399 RepID=A0ABU5ZF44_9BACL|nr:1-deoxy-D-xylulose-5-phosphate reductoisomerase [Paenibacillaceae bacterium T2]
MKRISILGSTGSIGTQALDVIAKHPDGFRVEGLAAGSNLEVLIRQIRQFRPRKVSVATRQLADELKLAVAGDVEIYSGDEGLLEIAAGTDADMVITALVGSQGLKSTLAAIEAGKQIGLANKETLVSGGHLVMELAARNRVGILPIDSEHSAIFQCLNGEARTDASRIILTASGGAFRDRTREQLKGVTVEQALRHPNWSMGAKITIDSATMVNKGLEVIEAHWLFGMDYRQIDVVLHPESIVHSMVEFADTSVIAQLGTPDMRVPIQYALTYPERLPSPGKRLDLTTVGSLHFRQMDEERFPCLKLAYECGRAGGTATAVFNAANEMAVARFLRREIEFLQIEDIIRQVVDRHQTVSVPQLEEILEADRWARSVAASL